MWRKDVKAASQPRTGRAQGSCDALRRARLPVRESAKCQRPSSKEQPASLRARSVIDTPSSSIRRRRSVSGTLDEARLVLRDDLNPAAIITAAGVVDKRYGYDAFGPVRVMHANFATRSSTCAWNWLYHGEFLDSESGMYDYGYRFYHPALGRWTSREPIGERGGVNLYGFVGSDGVNRGECLALCSLVWWQYIRVTGPSDDAELNRLQGEIGGLAEAAGFSKEVGDKIQDKIKSAVEDVRSAYPPSKLPRAPSPQEIIKFAIESGLEEAGRDTEERAKKLVTEMDERLVRVIDTIKNPAAQTYLEVSVSCCENDQVHRVKFEKGLGVNYNGWNDEEMKAEPHPAEGKLQRFHELSCYISCDHPLWMSSTLEDLDE